MPKKTKLDGDTVVEALKRKFRCSTERQLAAAIGITGQAVRNWRRRPSVTARQIAGLASNARKSGMREITAGAIRPIVEFFEIEGVDSRRRAKVELFDFREEDGTHHPYKSGVRSELKECKGIYIFFDSRGRAIYVGKAKKQNLWGEMKSAYNRERGDLQTIKKVNHPLGRKQYMTSAEKFRQIRDEEIPLYQLASYFSAYQVSEGLISIMEAMLVRSFANDLLNKRMERFAAKKRRKEGVRRVHG